ncbi:hypothetical protein A3C25_04485 [Candidatus Roizmanbacteria bacterium RIFCSPHIGHO2_02_FULL_38_11]|uniref:Uncharacterized protein n=1 Tax=Candidatus Roizmanbacteria bacterium RIFCSPHIGHO2_02_FULL_38_11 TaxID=1802039 RepID=A0A1F7GYI1_9BACT|nr:MAG: hypothetical protein A3C25_04485 [Candidatus Roizmanbacteria bacterium RIFCSPHIGHO2_02_FULL_38_11]
MGSYLGQRGAFIPTSIGSFTQWFTRDYFETLKRGQTILIDIPILNACKRPLIIPPDFKTFRLFYNRARILKGDRLRDAVKSGRIRISGIDFENLVLVGVPGDDPDGIQVPLDQNQRWWIPPDPHDKPIEFIETPDFRAEVRRDLVPINKIPPDESFLLISQTVPVITIRDQAITGMLSIGTMGHANFEDYGVMVPQLNSVILHPSSTDWPIITEQFIRLEPGQNLLSKRLPNSVALYFWENIEESSL